MISPIRLMLGGALCALLLAPGCVTENTVTPTEGSTGATTQELGLPGQACGCDTDCSFDGAICTHGMCAMRANGFCDAHNREFGCEAGYQCFNSDVVLDGGICFPTYDAESCAFVENRHGVCSPQRTNWCDPACGSGCNLDLPAEGAAGAWCSDDLQCNFSAGATCYQEDGVGDPNGWVEGYCLEFGCTSDDQCGGPGKSCAPIAVDGSGVCMERCGMDLDCRWGYTCRLLDPEDGGQSICRAGCDAAAICPDGNSCVGNLCIASDLACSTTNPAGYCPDGSWCDAGSCNDQPFACDGQDDTYEPNADSGSATEAPRGVTGGLALCLDDEDWWKITVPANTIVRVGVEFNHEAGDLDLVAYDAGGALMGSRIGKSYPYTYRDQETDTEYYGFHSVTGGDVFYVRVVGYGSLVNPVENAYTLHVDEIPYKDGETCTDDYTSNECTGQGGEDIIPFPFPNPADSFAGNTYVWDTFSNYRFARRELVMLVRNALGKTFEAFPGTSSPLGLIDTCQIDGITPGYDVGDPRHPESTHDQGGNQDLGYFQTDGNNESEIICGDGSKHADGFCSPAAVTMHKVDLPRQAFFMAQLYASPRVRVIGVDKIIGPLIEGAAEVLAALDPSDPQFISSSQLAQFKSSMAYGDGWPYHHHHIHLSMNWWTGASWSPATSPQKALSIQHPRLNDAARGLLQLNQAWPPAP